MDADLVVANLLKQAIALHLLEERCECSGNVPPNAVGNIMRRHLPPVVADGDAHFLFDLPIRGREHARPAKKVKGPRLKIGPREFP
jgi:hypothetical protein